MMCQVARPSADRLAGGVDFSGIVGQLWGNHFLTLDEGLQQLPEVGRRVLWQGAQPIAIEEVD
jgi:hypothetical protein